MITQMRLIGMVAATLLAGAAALPQASVSQTSSPWDQPAIALAGQIAEILGSGQAHLVIRNQSSISVDAIPEIRSLLVQDLKAHGVQASGAESASTIRVTLSENVRERVWVAEIVEGSETRVTMVHVEAGAQKAAPASGGLILRKEVVLTDPSPVLAALETSSGWIVLEPEELVFFGKLASGPVDRIHAPIGARRQLSRDPRGMLLPTASGDGFQVFTAGAECNAEFPAVNPAAHWTVSCHENDDPWPILQAASATNSSDAPQFLKAFYNAGRDSFTGVVTPNAGADLQPFYSAALISHPAGFALLVSGLDGKVQLVENGALKTVSGTRDWGSDFALYSSGCGAGSQIIVSGSGEALSDGLRAYELPALEAIPASAPLALDGTVTALWNARDGRSVLASVRHAAGDYEVDRVTALCN